MQLISPEMARVTGGPIAIHPSDWLPQVQEIFLPLLPPMQLQIR